MSQKHQRSVYRENTYVSLMIENVTRIKSGIAINIGVSAKIQKSIIHLKKIIFGILRHVVVKLMNI